MSSIAVCGRSVFSPFPSVELPAFVECAGTGRRFFASRQGTPVTRTQWGLGAVDVMPAGLDPE